MVLIKEMKMPEKCSECPFTKRYIDVPSQMYCTLSYCGFDCKDGESIHPYCPLISVDDVIEQMETLRKQAADGGNFNAASYVESCIAILRGLEK